MSQLDETLVHDAVKALFKHEKELEDSKSKKNLLGERGKWVLAQVSCQFLF